METYIATIAVPNGWMPGHRIEQFEFEHPKAKELTHEDIMRAARQKKYWRNFSAITAIKKQ